MSSTGDFQRVYSQLVELFLMPLLQGGEVKIPPLLAPSCFELLEAFAKPITEADLRVARLLHIQALNLLPLKSIPWPSPSLIACAATLSHLAYLLDPLLSKPWYQRAFARAYGWAYEWVDHLPPPESVGEAVVRHLLLQSFRALRRRDITINTWIATYHFWGRPVPWNVTALPKLRRVRFTLNEERSLAEIIRLKSQEVKNIPGFTSLYEQAFARISPLDTLLNPTPALELDENKAQWLSDRFLRMAICNAFLQLDTSSLLELLGKITINATSYPHPHRALVVSFSLEVLLLWLLATSHPQETSFRCQEASFCAALLCKAWDHEKWKQRLGPLSPKDWDKVLHLKRMSGSWPTSTIEQANFLLEHTSPSFC